MFVNRSLFLHIRRRPFLFYDTKSLSSSLVSERLIVDPATLVQGVTKERLDSDPTLAEFFLANFPHAFSKSENTDTSDDVDLNTILLNPSELEAVKRYDEKIRLRKERAAIEKTMVYERNIRPLTTYLRDPNRDEGTRNSKRLRYHEGMIPGLLYGGDPNLKIYSHQPESKTFLKTPWKVLQRELDRYRHNFESRVYKLTVKANPEDPDDSRVHIVTPQNVQRHPLLETIYCANFLRYHALRPLKIPIRYINVDESPALKRDAFMLPIQRFIECYVEEGADIPESIDLECTGLLMKQVVRKDRLIFPEGVRMTQRALKRGDDLIIGVVRGGLRGDDTEEQASAEKAEDKGASKPETKATETKADNKPAAKPESKPASKGAKK